MSTEPSTGAVETIKAGREDEREALRQLHDEAFTRSNPHTTFDPHSAIWGAARVLLILRERAPEPRQEVGLPANSGGEAVVLPPDGQER